MCVMYGIAQTYSSIVVFGIHNAGLGNTAYCSMDMHAPATIQAGGSSYRKTTQIVQRNHFTRCSYEVYTCIIPRTYHTRLQHHTMRGITTQTFCLQGIIVVLLHEYSAAARNRAAGYL